MSDAYADYSDLANQKTENVDFRICVDDRESHVSIIAPHGGKIEQHTSEIAAAIAGDSYNLYRFEGLMREDNFRCLHVTSTHFDEPQCLRLVAKSAIVIAVHGRGDNCNGSNDPNSIWLGGLDSVLTDLLLRSLRHAEFEVRTQHSLPGRERNNICNRGLTNAGIQLELPLSLRKILVADRGRRLGDFAEALHVAIKSDPRVLELEH